MDTLFSDDNNIILINNKLDKFIDYIPLKEPCFTFYHTSLEKISNEITKIKNTEKENILIIINRELYNEKIQKKIKKLFSSKLNIYNPHFLFISSNEYSIEEQNKIVKEQNFFYQLTKSEQNKIETTGLYFFLKMIFQRMKDISRLDNYIVNAFQTIIDSKIISKQKQEIERLYEELDILSKMDYLTKVLNRKAFFDAMDAERNRTLRNDRRLNKIKQKIKSKDKKDEKYYINNPSNNFLEHFGNFSCMMIDIDHFKMINDTHGHLIGDQVLKELGELLKSKIIFRDNDIIGRYGGEEFIIILPETNAENTKIPAERLREEIKKINFKGKNDKIFHVSISTGISEFKLTDKTNDELIDRADKAMYHAKQQGRDLTVVYEEVLI